MNNKGQSILSEYVMIFFVVIAAVVAMTTFVQRGFQGRINDARNFMVASVANSNACDANCVKATGGNIAYEYEPYYAGMLSVVQQNADDATGATSGNAQALGAIYLKSMNEETNTGSFSCQLPPECSTPACASIKGVSTCCYCNCPSTCPNAT